MNASSTIRNRPSDCGTATSRTTSGSPRRRRTPADGAALTVALRRLEAARDDLWAALAWARDQEAAEADRRLGDVLTRLTDQLAEPTVRLTLIPLLAELRRLGLPA